MHPFPYKIHRKHVAFMVSLVCILLWGVFCSTVFAEAPHSGKPEYVPLVGIPYAQNASGKGLANYLNSIYILTMILGGIIAVIRIMIAGVKYSFDEIVTRKSEAKEEIKGTLLGLAVLMIPFIVLSTIYSGPGKDTEHGLTNLDILGGVEKISLDSPSNITATSPSVPSGTNVNECRFSLGELILDNTTSSGRRQEYIDTSCKSDCAGVNGTYAITQDPSKSTCTFICPEGTTYKTKFGGAPVCEKIQVKLYTQTYTKSELTPELDETWKKKCADDKKVIDRKSTPDGGRTYSCIDD